MQQSAYKKFFVNLLIGSLIGAGGVGVVAVLTGGFNDTLAKTLFTLFSVAIHALLALAYLDATVNQQEERNLSFFKNTLFVLIILSFFTSVFGIWNVLPGDIVARLYITYGVLIFAILHGELLAKTTGLEKKTDNLVRANYLIMALVILMIMPLIWLRDLAYLSDVYYRILAALAIIDFTLTALVAIFNKLYLQKHPKTPSPVFTQVYDDKGKPIMVSQGHPKRHLRPLIWILIIFLLAQFIIPLLLALTTLSI